MDVNRPEKSGDNLYDLLRQMDYPGFDCHKIGQLKVLALKAKVSKDRVKMLLVGMADLPMHIDGVDTAKAAQDRSSFTVAKCERPILDAPLLNLYPTELGGRWR